MHDDEGPVDDVVDEPPVPQEPAVPVTPEAPEPESGDVTDRRSFLGGATLVMGAGLAASYGAFAAYAGRYLYPAKKDPRGWFYVADVARLGEGDAMTYVAPGGARVVVARQGAADTAESFMALSSTCPHLGCQVHWEAHNSRFFCPCHNGVFDPTGKGTGGPPGDAGQDLPRYPLKVENGLLYIEVPLPTVASAEGDGHDPCLKPCAHRKGAGERA